VALVACREGTLADAVVNLPPVDFQVVYATSAGTTTSYATAAAGFPLRWINAALYTPHDDVSRQSGAQIMAAGSPTRTPMITNAQRRALTLLVGCPHGCTVAKMLAHGFTNAMLDSLERDGLVALQPGTVRTGTRRITVVWVAITDTGRAVVAAQS